MPDTSWLSDPIGRINNLSLAPTSKNTFQPLFEALMNSIHAIEERFGKGRLTEGIIKIKMAEDANESFAGFIITDNGIGFNPDNMISFRTSDSMKKKNIGGKGVGRLLWLKVVEKISISSCYRGENGKTLVRFDFVADPDVPISNFNENPTTEELSTTINLTPYKNEYSNFIPPKLETIAERIVAHFINYFVNIDCPQIILSDSKKEINIFDYFTNDIVRDDKYTIGDIESIKVGNPEHTLNCFLVPKNYSDSESGTNALFFGAHGRAVKRFPLDQSIGLKIIDGKNAFYGYLEGPALNDSVNDTRTDFSLGDEIIDELKKKCIEKIRFFLSDEINKIRQSQINTIEKVRNEHLRFYNIAKTPSDIAEKIALKTQSEEDIFIELSRYSLRRYKQIKREFNNAKEKNLSTIDQKAREYVNELKEESLSSLAEYTYKRKLIIDLFVEQTGYSDIDKKKYHYEKMVHEVICPLRSSSSELNYEDHNLWIIDDRLAFFTYFNSDKQLKEQVDCGDSDRPDITFFDLGMGFEKKGSREPISIIEFKRPSRNDYSMSDNPFMQVQNYVEKFREAGQATRFDGSRIRSIESDTPFLCQIVADDTPTLRNVMNRLNGFYKRAGSGSYYRWDSHFKIFMEVTSYEDLISDAKSRNEAFFEKLGINP